MAFTSPKDDADQRGYGAEHRTERKHWVRLIEAGELVLCHFCGKQIVETNGNLPDGLNLDHTPDRSAYRGPAHRLCNIRDGAKRGRARQGTPKRLVL